MSIPSFSRTLPAERRAEGRRARHGRNGCQPYPAPKPYKHRIGSKSCSILVTPFRWSPREVGVSSTRPAAVRNSQARTRTCRSNTGNRTERHLPNLWLPGQFALALSAGALRRVSRELTKQPRRLPVRHAWFSADFTVICSRIPANAAGISNVACRSLTAQFLCFAYRNYAVPLGWVGSSQKEAPGYSCIYGSRTTFSEVSPASSCASRATQEVASWCVMK